MAAVLEGLGVPVLETILSKVAFSDAAAAACVSTTLRSVASDDALWRHFCARDLAVCDHPLDPDGNPCHSFKVSLFLSVSESVHLTHTSIDLFCGASFGSTAVY